MAKEFKSVLIIWLCWVALKTDAFKTQIIDILLLILIIVLFILGHVQKCASVDPSEEVSMITLDQLFRQYSVAKYFRFDLLFI